jgi:Domain of unknown function (DUF4388)
MDDALKARLEQAAGAWRVLDSPAGLLLALRDRGGALYAEVSRFGAGRPSMAGDLAEMQPSDLLNFLHQGRRTGVLLTGADGVDRAIVLVEGNVAWASSTIARERQGGVVETFLGLLVVRSGSFVFLRGVDRAALPASLSLDTQGMLLDGLRRLDEMELYRTRVPAPNVAPRRTGKNADGQVTNEGRQVLALADGTRTVADLAIATALGEFEATKAAYALIERGFLRL